MHKQGVFTGALLDSSNVVQSPSSPKDAEVRLTEDLFLEYESKRRDWEEQAIEDDDFRKGAQWSSTDTVKLERIGMAAIVVNVIYPAVEQAKALLTTNKPRFSAVGREDSDVRMGRLISEALTYVWDQSDGNAELKMVIDDMYVKGLGCAMVYFDPHADFGKGEVLIKSLDPLWVYFDPATQDRFGRDSANIIVFKQMTYEQLVHMQSEMADILDQATPSTNKRLTGTMTSAQNQGHADKPSRDGYHVLYDVYDRYTKIKVPHQRVLNPQSGQEWVLNEEQFAEFVQKDACIVQDAQGVRAVTRDEEIAQFLQLYQEFGPVHHYEMDATGQQPMPVAGEENPDNPLNVPQSTVMITPVKMEALLANGMLQAVEILMDRVKRVLSVGGVLVWSGILPITQYPIVPFMSHFDRGMYPNSDVRIVKPLQEYVNKIRSLTIAHASNTVGMKLLVEKQSVDKKKLLDEWQNVGAQVIEVEAGASFPPTPLGPPPLPNELYKLEAETRRDIQEILGIYTLMQGDPGVSPQTYKGTLALDEYGQRRIKSKQDDIEASLNQLAEVAVELMQAYWTQEKTIRILQPNMAPKELQINTPIYDSYTQQETGRINDITSGKYDVQIVSGSMLPSNRWARFDYYMELYKAGIIDQVEVLKQTDVADIEGVLNRASQMAQMQRMIQEQEEQIKKLKGDLQTAEREVVHAKRDAEMTRVKGKLDKVANRAEAAEQVYSGRLADEVQLFTRQASMSQKEE